MGDLPVNWAAMPEALGYFGNAATQFGNARLPAAYQSPLPYNPTQQWQRQLLELQAGKLKREAEQEKAQMAAWTGFTTPEALPEGVSGPPAPSQAASMGMTPGMIELAKSSGKGPDLLMALIAEQAKRSSYRPMTPQEATAYGLPPGSSGVIDTKTGQPSVLNKSDVLSADALKQKMDIAQAGKPTTEIKMGESLSKPIGEIAKETREAARGAIDTRNTTNRIREAMEGAAIGPASTVQQGLDRIAVRLGIADQDTETKLAKTRTVIKGLSELTLAGRKALKGQGQISDFEGKLLERAASGDIDTLVPSELNVILDVADRVADESYSEHEMTLEAIRGNEQHKGLAPFYRVKPMPERYQPKARAPFITPEQARQELERRRRGQ